MLLLLPLQEAAAGNLLSDVRYKLLNIGLLSAGVGHLLVLQVGVCMSRGWCSAAACSQRIVQYITPVIHLNPKLLQSPGGCRAETVEAPFCISSALFGKKWVQQCTALSLHHQPACGVGWLCSCCTESLKASQKMIPTVHTLVRTALLLLLLLPGDRLLPRAASPGRPQPVWQPAACPCGHMGGRSPAGRRRPPQAGTEDHSLKCSFA